MALQLNRTNRTSGDSLVVSPKPLPARYWFFNGPSGVLYLRNGAPLPAGDWGLPTAIERLPEHVRLGDDNAYSMELTRRALLRFGLGCGRIVRTEVARIDDIGQFEHWVVAFFDSEGQRHLKDAAEADQIASALFACGELHEARRVAEVSRQAKARNRPASAFT